MRLWRNNSGPCMQVLHFTFAFGAFIAPLIAKDFISEDTPSVNTNSTRFTSAAPFFETEATIANHTIPVVDHSPRFKLAYWIVSAIFLPTLAAFLYFAAKYDFLEGGSLNQPNVVKVPSNEDSVVTKEESVRYSKKKMKTELEDTAKETVAGAPLGDDLSASGEESSYEKEEVIFTRNSLGKTKVSQEELERNILSTKAALLTRYRYTILLLLAAFMFVYVGLEVAYGNLIFTATVVGRLKFSKHQASLLQAVFWGLFTFGRLISILLVVFKVRSSIMISMNLFGSFVAAIIMVAFVHKASAIWVASIVLGASYSSIFPTTMTWMSETVEATGVATAILIAGGILGNIVLSVLVGFSIAAVSPDMLFYLTLVGVVISGAIAGGMFWTSHIQRQYDKQKSPVKPNTLKVSNSSSKEEEVMLMEVRDQSDDEDDE